MTWGFGKVILLGEHAVVYDHPAVAGALSLGVHAQPGDGPNFRTFAPNTRSSLSFSFRDGSYSSDPPAIVLDAFAAIVTALDADQLDLHLQCDVSLPIGAGLGSSAALSVAATRAVAEAIGRQVSDDVVERIANEAERCFHGTPSGIDVAMACRGGLGVFRRSTGLRPLAAAPVRLAIGLSGQPKRTADMVGRVAAAVAAEPARAEPLLAALGALASAGAGALEAGDLNQLGALMNDAHTGLARLGLSTAVLDDMVAVARNAGAVGAKLTGGGGGGAVIALAPGREAAIVAAWQARGWDAFDCVVGVSHADVSR